MNLPDYIIPIGKSPRQERIDGLKVKFFTSVGMAVFSAIISAAAIFFAAYQSPLTSEMSHKTVGTAMFFAALAISLVFRATNAWRTASMLDSARN